MPPPPPPVPLSFSSHINEHCSSSSGGEPYDLKVDGAGFRYVDGRYSRLGRELVDGVPYYTQLRRSRGGDGVGLVVSVFCCLRTGYISRRRYVESQRKTPCL